MRVALELETSSAAALVLKGEALLRKGDAIAAIEVLTKVKQLAPGDAAAKALLAEAELARDGAGDKAGGGLGYVDLGDSMTKHYPSHQGNDGSGQSGSHTRPTSLEKRSDSRPRATGRRSSQRNVEAPDTIPSDDILAIGDRSGTVELDPEAEGVELDDDFGDIADPPSTLDEPMGPTGRVPRQSPAAAAGRGSARPMATGPGGK